MRGFLLGLLVAGLAFGGYLVWKNSQESRGPGAEARPDAGAVKKKKRRRGRGATRVARGKLAADGTPRAGEPEPEAELEPEPDPPMKLTASDLRSVSQGDDLGRPDVVRLDMGNDNQLPELSQDDIDARFRAQEDAILDCISKARPHPEVYVPGLVNVKFRIQRTGAIKGVRVDAPAVLQKGGLTSCVRGVVERLRFPSSGSSQIVTYPFRLS